MTKTVAGGLWPKAVGGFGQGRAIRRSQHRHDPHRGSPSSGHAQMPTGSTAAASNHGGLLSSGRKRRASHFRLLACAFSENAISCFGLSCHDPSGEEALYARLAAGAHYRC